MKLLKTASGKQTIKISHKEWTSIGKKAGWIRTAMKVVKEDISYKASPYGYIATIPKGTPVKPATNLPDGGYWAEDWEGMDEKASSWSRNYGFHLNEEDVVDSFGSIEGVSEMREERLVTFYDSDTGRVIERETFFVEGKDEDERFHKLEQEIDVYITDHFENPDDVDYEHRLVDVSG